MRTWELYMVHDNKSAAAACLSHGLMNPNGGCNYGLAPTRKESGKDSTARKVYDSKISMAWVRAVSLLTGAMAYSVLRLRPRQMNPDDEVNLI